MKNKTILLVLFIVVVIVGFGVFTLYPKNKDISIKNEKATSPKDATYRILGQPVTLIDGVSVVPIASTSASKITTQYFGNEVTHDFDGDGRMDNAFILTQNTGGSGTFYYVVAALNTTNGYVGSEGVLLGDRIAPQTTEMGKGNTIIVNYADRKSGESFATAPSVGKSLSLLLDPKTIQLGEVAQNFEGEADPGKMTLDMQTWNWVQTVYGDGTTVVPSPNATKRFTITFKNKKSFSATTDCNGVGGEYTLDGNKIMFTQMMSTLMYCQNSQEQDFTKMLGETESYHFTSKGELVFDLKVDSGSMIFR